jgi:hypothetical protein
MRRTDEGARWSPWTFSSMLFTQNFLVFSSQQIYVSEN